MTQKKFLPILILAVSSLLIGCSSNQVSNQTRSDLTAEHVRGLYADMNRSDVEDLLGKSDSALAENESFEMYSLADGTTAILRYAGDKLQAAYIRGKDNIEEAIFNNYDGTSPSQINDGTNESNNNGANNNTSNGTDNNTTNNSGTNNSNNTNNNNGTNNNGIINSNGTDNTNGTNNTNGINNNNINETNDTLDRSK